MKKTQLFIFSVIFAVLIASSSAFGQAQINTNLQGQPAPANARVNFVIHVQPRLDLTIADQQITINSNTGNLYIDADNSSFISDHEVIAKQVTARNMVTFASP